MLRKKNWSTRRQPKPDLPCGTTCLAGSTRVRSASRMKSTWPVAQDVLAGQAKEVSTGVKKPARGRADAASGLVAFGGKASSLDHLAPLAGWCGRQSRLLMCCRF